MNSKSKKRGNTLYIIILGIVLAMLIGAALFNLGLWFGGAGSGSGTTIETSQPSEKQSSQTNEEFIVKVDKSTYIIPNGERLENLEQLIKIIQKLEKPKLIINAKQASIRSSSQIKQALNKMGIPYKWEE